jgi:protein AroM
MTSRQVAVAATITIGQSPRPDIVDEIRPVLGSSVRVIEAGALDGLDRQQIEAMRPDPGDHALVTLLRDGQEVLVGHHHVLPRLQACIDRLQDEADVILMLCTGTFPHFATRRPILYPEQLLFQMARAVAPGVRVGVLTPSGLQIADQERRWGEVASAVSVQSFSPYTAGDDLDGACAAFRGAAVDVVALDCLGYTLALKEQVRQQVDRPVLLARTVLARVAAELLD